VLEQCLIVYEVVAVDLRVDLLSILPAEVVLADHPVSCLIQNILLSLAHCLLHSETVVVSFMALVSIVAFYRLPDWCIDLHLHVIAVVLRNQSD
jgi:hypothetical protein